MHGTNQLRGRAQLSDHLKLVPQNMPQQASMAWETDAGESGVVQGHTQLHSELRPPSQKKSHTNQNAQN